VGDYDLRVFFILDFFAVFFDLALVPLIDDLSLPERVALFLDASVSG